MLQQLVDILLSRGDYKLAKSLLLKMHPEEMPFRLLKLAEIARLEKDYRQLGALLKKLRRLPAALRAECFYLKFSHAEKFGHARQADGFRKRIQSDYFQHLCMIQLVDRYIYGGHFAQAETLLSRALQFFSSQKHPLEHIQIETQRAKLLREKGERIKAEQLYKDMFIFSKTRKFGLLSAQIAVDLGNLYLTQDDAPRAEMWYRKADYLFVAEEHLDGQLLVQSNLIDILIWKGQWREAEALLTRVLAYDDDRQVHSALAIDYFNLAFLEWLRHNFNSSQRWLEKAGNLFSQTQNRNGLLECLLLKNKMAFLSDDALDDISCRQKQLNRDQQIFQRLLQINPADPGFSQHCQDISLIGSKQLRFDALLLLTRRWRIKQLLPALQDLALEMSGERKNYHYYEYHYVFFELLDNASSLLPAQTELFRETLDFFTHNKRRISDPLLAIKSHLTQQESTRDIFRSAKLVSEARQWKMPEDFFKSLLQEIDKNPSIELIRLAVYEGQRRLYFFSSPPAFPELSEEIIQHSLGSPAVCDYLLADIRKIFSSQEKIFYSYAATKVIPWKMGNGRNAFLLLASSSADFQRQDFLARHRDTLAKFAALFQQYLERDHPIHQQLSFIVGQSPAILQLKDLISKVSQVDFSLLISGESGSGKELVAKAVHLLSARANKPFISVNAAAIPENLLEAELFGYKKGAFSGATESHIGLIEAADQGTLFLDEIADLPLNLQAKLLRVLQEREIRRLGETRTVKVNIRLISATNKNLQALIKKNLFREELYYRLQDLTLSLPPLRERCGDIPLLVQHFFNKYQSPALEEDQFQELIAHFLNHPFPGNVRELESKIKAFITFGQLPAMGGYPPPQEKALNLKEAKEAYEKSFLRNSLKAHHWNKSQTAQRLQISRMNLFNLIKKHQLHNDDEADS